MKPSHREPPPGLSLRIGCILAACAALAAGAWGIALAGRHMPEHRLPRGPMLLAPMMGVIEPCIRADAAGTPPGDLADLASTCTGPDGSAAALVESTLETLRPHSTAPAPYPLGYTLPVPLLHLFKMDRGAWVIDHEMIGRLVRTVRDTDRALILYLFSTHFEARAPLEQALSQDASNLAQTRDGPLAKDTYYGATIYNWTLASTRTDITALRVEAAQAFMAELCKLAPRHLAKIRGVTLLGESHQLFPDFQGGMGFQGPYRITDYSRESIAGFQEFLRLQFHAIAQFNRVMGTDYASFQEVLPPSKDIRTEPLQRYVEHIDSFAHGSIPITGWAFVEGPQEMAKPLWVHIYRNGEFIAKRPVDMGRQDVLQALPEAGERNTGWRFDLDYRQLPVGMHRIDVYLEQRPGVLAHAGTRDVAIMERSQHTPRLLAQQPLPSSVALDRAAHVHVDLPENQSSYYYNPLVPLWHAFRNQQVARYIRFFNEKISASCLAGIPHYTHQILPFTNPGWDANKFAIDMSLRNNGDIRLGVSLYGEPTYGRSFFQWYAHTAHQGYGITEFHPLKAMDAMAMRRVLDAHAAQGAEFLSFFVEPRWRGKLAPRPHNIFSFDPDNPRFGSNALYRAMQAPQDIASHINQTAGQR
jgi:hypothetical protein